MVQIGNSGMHYCRIFEPVLLVSTDCMICYRYKIRCRIAVLLERYGDGRGRMGLYEDKNP